MQESRTTGIARILIVRLSSIGDIILTTPLLRALKESIPQAEITFIIKKQYAALLEDSPLVDTLVAYDKAEGFRGWMRLKKRLKKEHFDLYLDIHGSLRSRLLRMGLGSRKTFTYPKYLFRRYMLILFRINCYRHLMPVYLRYFESVKRLGIRYDGKGTEIHVPASDSLAVSARLRDLGWQSAGRLVVICPGATYSNKQWNKEGFIETARHLAEKANAGIILHGGKDDMNLCAEIADRTGYGAVNLAGQLSLSGSAALFQHSSLVIANDSGMLHLAQSQKIPVVGIYGPTTRELGFYPLPMDSRVVETDLPCRPCTPKGLNYCPKKHFRCMNDIHPGQVIDAAISLLNRTPGHPDPLFIH